MHIQPRKIYLTLCAESEGIGGQIYSASSAMGKLGDNRPSSVNERILRTLSNDELMELENSFNHHNQAQGQGHDYNLNNGDSSAARTRSNSDVSHGPGGAGVERVTSREIRSQTIPSHTREPSGDNMMTGVFAVGSGLDTDVFYNDDDYSGSSRAHTPERLQRPQCHTPSSSSSYSYSSSGCLLSTRASQYTIDLTR